MSRRVSLPAGFNSRSREGATWQEWFRKVTGVVSIHAPVRERPDEPDALAVGFVFQFTLP